MLAALDRHWRPLFATAVYTGMRKGELIALRKSDVDLTAGTVVVARSHASNRPLRFHDLRHTTATLLLKAGVPLATVQRILRHSDPAITSEIYGHLDVEDIRKGLNQLAFGPMAPGPSEFVPQASLAAGAEPAPLAARLLLESGSPKR